MDTIHGPVLKPGCPQRAAVTDAVLQDPPSKGKLVAVLPSYVQHLRVVVRLALSRIARNHRGPERWPPAHTSNSPLHLFMCEAIRNCLCVGEKSFTDMIMFRHCAGALAEVNIGKMYEAICHLGQHTRIHGGRQQSFRGPQSKQKTTWAVRRRHYHCEYYKCNEGPYRD